MFRVDPGTLSLCWIMYHLWQFWPFSWLQKELRERLSYLPPQLLASIKGSACRMPAFPHYSELDERKEEPKWGRPKVMRTSQLMSSDVELMWEKKTRKKRRTQQSLDTSEGSRNCWLISNFSLKDFHNKLTLMVTLSTSRVISERWWLCCCHGDV